jgi:hypothetical protein
MFYFVFVLDHCIFLQHEEDLVVLYLFFFLEMSFFNLYLTRNKCMATQMTVRWEIWLRSVFDEHRLEDWSECLFPVYHASSDANLIETVSLWLEKMVIESEPSWSVNLALLIRGFFSFFCFINYYYNHFDE